MKQTNHIYVLYIITKLELGGAQKVCLSLVNGLQQSGAHSFLISSKKGLLVNKIDKSPHIILLDELDREVSCFKLIREIRCFFTLIKKIRSLNKKYPHLIVHTHSTKAGILGRWAAFFARVKWRIHTIHGYAFHKFQAWYKWLPIYCIELITSLITTHFVCVSLQDAKKGVHYFPRFAKKHSIIRAGVDIKQFYIPARKTTMSDNLRFRPFVFGTISCFKPQKNLFDLINAFTYVSIKEPHAQLEIIGDGILRPDIEEFIAQRSLTNRVTLHGWKDNVARIMVNWNGFVLSSLWEGLPCAIVEARLLHLPVISYKTDGIQDIIFHKKNGLLYNQKDWRGLAEGMLTVIKDKNLYYQLQNYKDDLIEFSCTQMIQQHIQLYKAL